MNQKNNHPNIIRSLGKGTVLNQPCAVRRDVEFPEKHLETLGRGLSIYNKVQLALMHFRLSYLPLPWSQSRPKEFSCHVGLSITSVLPIQGVQLIGETNANRFLIIFPWYFPLSILCQPSHTNIQLTLFCFFFFAIQASPSPLREDAIFIAITWWMWASAAHGMNESTGEITWLIPSQELGKLVISRALGSKSTRSGAQGLDSWPAREWGRGWKPRFSDWYNWVLNGG